jgi:hypothetical protein
MLTMQSKPALLLLQLSDSLQAKQQPLYRAQQRGHPVLLPARHCMASKRLQTGQAGCYLRGPSYSMLRCGCSLDGVSHT